MRTSITNPKESWLQHCDGFSVDKESRWSLLTLDQEVTPLTIFFFTSHWNSSYFCSSCFHVIYTQTPRCCDLVRVLGWWIQLVLWKVRISRSSTLPRCEAQITWAELWRWVKCFIIFLIYIYFFYSSCDLNMAELVKTADGVLDVCCVPEYTEYTPFQ